MKWQGRRKSDNVEDRRGISGGQIAVGGGVIGIIVLLLNLFGGDNAKMLTPVLEQMQQGQQSAPTEQVELTPEQKELGDFASTVFADTEDIWHKIFEENGMTYEEPKMVLFTGQVQTACGGATSASGPFYCPGDKKVYMDLEFFEELRTRLELRGVILPLRM